MTTPAALACLEQLACARGLRVAWREAELEAAPDPDERRGLAGADAAPLVRFVIAPPSARVAHTRRAGLTC
jgi:hypothetical protein